jgi:hypothetical protein
MAAKFAWDLYCAVLPSGWFVDTGSFTLGSGGTVLLAYRNNAGGRFELKQGAWCEGAPLDCGPFDVITGSAMFGDLTGQLGKLSSSLVLYVRPGLNPAWAATGTGLDDATMRSFCRALSKVAKS